MSDAQKAKFTSPHATPSSASDCAFAKKTPRPCLPARRRRRGGGGGGGGARGGGGQGGEEARRAARRDDPAKAPPMRRGKRLRPTPHAPRLRSSARGRMPGKRRSAWRRRARSASARRGRARRSANANWRIFTARSSRRTRQSATRTPVLRVCARAGASRAGGGLHRRRRGGGRARRCGAQGCQERRLSLGKGGAGGGGLRRRSEDLRRARCRRRGGEGVALREVGRLVGRLDRGFLLRSFRREIPQPLSGDETPARRGVRNAGPGA